MASLAGAVLGAVAGFGGVRDYGGRLSFRPRLPNGIDRLRFSLELRGTVLRVQIGSDSTTFTLAQGDSVRFTHWDEEVTLQGGDSVTLDIPSHEEEDAPVPPPGREPRAGRKRLDWPEPRLSPHPYGDEVHFVGPSAPHVADD